MNTEDFQRRTWTKGLAVCALLALTSCSNGDDSTAEATVETPPVDADLLIVASTDVYADLAAQVVGDTAEVEALVDNPAVDPHSYEATAQDRLRVDQADVIIANGGGYDSFITLLAAAAGTEDNVFQLIEGESQHAHDDDDHGDHAHDDDHGDHGGHDNEHVWYDLHRMSEFVVDFGGHLGELVPENAELYNENAQILASKIQALDERNQDISGEGVAYLATEAVSGYLLQDAGFEDLTDVQFLAAVEHGDDVSPRLYQESLNLATGNDIDLLAYNSQTETNQSSRIRSAAEEAGVPVLEFSETLPDGIDSYLDWMEDNISRLEALVESLDG